MLRRKRQAVRMTACWRPRCGRDRTCFCVRVHVERTQMKSERSIVPVRSIFLSPSAYSIRITLDYGILDLHPRCQASKERPPLPKGLLGRQTHDHYDAHPLSSSLRKLADWSPSDRRPILFNFKATIQSTAAFLGRKPLKDGLLVCRHRLRRHSRLLQRPNLRQMATTTCHFKFH